MRTPGSRTTKTTTERDAPFGRLGPLPRGRGRVRGELRRKTVRWICSTALLLAAGHCALAAPEEKPRNPCHLDGAYVMGTLLEVRLCHENGARAAAMVIDQARQFDATFTTWADAGPVIELNRAAGSQWQSKDPDVLAILREALDWTAVTQGAFDVSVGPLIDVWQRAEQQDLPPRPEELGEALRHVGARHVDVSEDGVRLAAGTSVDLGGIAKGFALDRIAEDLRRHGIDRGLVDFGQSSLLALGPPPGEEGWTLAVRRPDGPLIGTIELRNTSLSVSASYGRTFEVAGKEYAHVIDPRTGSPIAEQRLAVVVSTDASQAEALSTALIVEGAGGLDVIEGLAESEALLVSGPEGYTRQTSGFAAATGFVASPLPSTRAGRPPGIGPRSSDQKMAPRGGSPSNTLP
jgi:thiamine biosynthesis lipoprotein